MKTNKLSIYLIKDGFTDQGDIIRKKISGTKKIKDASIKQVQIKGIGTFYYKKSRSSKPTWIESFFLDTSELPTKELFGSSVSALLVVDINYKSSNKTFALTFGVGRFLLEDGCYEERFGLITTLNLIKPESIRSLDKITVSNNTKLTKEQISKASSAIEFQVDFERDILNSLTGISKDSDFGTVISGKDALSISMESNVSNIKEVLSLVMDKYEDTTYKSNFSWIDNIKMINDKNLISELNSKCKTDLLNNSHFVWLSIPEIIEWNDVSGFKFSKRKTDNLLQEISVDSFLFHIGYDEETSVDKVNLENFSVTCWSDSTDSPKYSWPLSRCINAEVDYENRKYILSDSKWYEIDATFVDDVDAEIERILPSSIKFPSYKHSNEEEYNEFCSKVINGLNCDQKFIKYGGGGSKIELCDILTEDGSLIHVKKMGGSSVLSHLFSQGLVSAELLVSDDTFREKAIKEIPLPLIYTDIMQKDVYNSKKRSVCFVIIDDRQNAFNRLPFFSKITLRNVNRRLRVSGFDCRVNFVKNETKS